MRKKCSKIGSIHLSAALRHLFTKIGSYFQGFFNNYFFLCSNFRMSWFVVYSVMVSIVSLIGTILMHLIVLDNSRGNVGTFFLLFVLILEFGLSMIMFAFIMTTLFSKVFQNIVLFYLALF